MKNCIQYLLILIFFVSCASPQSKASKPCNGSLWYNDYRSIYKLPFVFRSTNDSLVVNEIRFECIKPMMGTSKAMFDNYRMWDRWVKPDSMHQPILIWDDIQLLENNPKRFIVATYGTETMKQTYSSIMVFDEQMDFLSDESKYKELIINRFTTLMRDNNEKNKNFYKAYWQDIDPIHFNKIKANFKQ